MSWDAAVTHETLRTADCAYCHGRGWLMTSFDPDVDIDCPVCTIRRPL